MKTFLKTVVFFALLGAILVPGTWLWLVGHLDKPLLIDDRVRAFYDHHGILDWQPTETL